MQSVRIALRGGNKSLINFGIYFSTNVIRKLIPFLLLPIITSRLPPDEYGRWSLYQVIVLFVIPVVGMNMQNNITRNFFKQDKKAIAEVITQICVLLAINTAIGLTLIWGYISAFGDSGIFPAPWLFLVVLLAVANLIFDLDLTVLRNEKRPVLYGLLQIANAIFNLAVTIFLVVLLDYGWEGPAIGFATTTLFFGGVALIQLWYRGYIALRIDGLILREVLKVSLPLVPHALCAVITTMSDRLFLERMLGIDIVGVYSIGYQLGMAILLITESFNLVWGPWLYEQLSHLTPIRQRRIVIITYAYYGFIVILGITTSIISIFVLRLFISASYDEAQYYIPWVTMGYVARAMYTMVFPYLIFTGKTHFLGIAGIVSAAVNLVGNYVLITLNGAVGAAQSTLLTYLLWFIMIWWYAQRIHPMPWGLGWLRKKGA